MTLVLASASPRRRDLLSRLTSDFRVVASCVDETADGSPEDRVLAVAKRKARAVGKLEQGIIVGADTVVVVDGEILEKPMSRAHAHRMLSRLSGRSHEVMTGLCAWDTATGSEHTHCERTRVAFRELDAREIDAYLDGGEYLDKAGGYAIQGVAAKFVTGIEGDYTNVMGLPLCRLTLLLRELGVWL